MKVGISISGGGAKQAAAVGKLQYMADADILPDGAQMFAGTSAGGIISAGFAMFPPTGEGFKAGARYVSDAFLGLQSSEDIWVYRWCHWMSKLPILKYIPLLAGVKYPSVGDNAPFKKLLEKLIDPEAILKSGVELRLTGVDVLSGLLYWYDQHYEDLRQAITITSTFPGYFPPEDVGVCRMTDGGVREINPIKPLIDAGCEIIYVLPAQNPWRMHPIPRESVDNTLSFLHRVVDIMSNEILRNDIEKCKAMNVLVADGKRIDKKFVNLQVLPQNEDLGNPLDFDHGLMKSRWDMGYEIARNYFKGVGT